MTTPLLENIESLVRSARTAPSADNSQPWHFIWDGKKLSIIYDSDRVQGRTFPPNAPATLLSIGGVIENIAQISQSIGVTADIDQLPTDFDYSGSYAYIKLSDCVKNNGKLEDHPVFQRHTNRFAYNDKPIPTDIINRLSSFTEGNARLVNFTDRDTKKVAASLVRSASEVRFQTKEVHEWLGASLRFTDATVKKADGLDVQTLDLPPGGRQFLHFISDWKHMNFLNKFAVYRLLAYIDSNPVRLAPAIIGVTAQTDNKAVICAGRLLTRIWAFLNSQGIAVHPYYVISDQLSRLTDGTVPDDLAEQVTDLKEGCVKLMGLGSEETVHMLLRVGYPTRQPPRSLRLPLKKVFTNLAD